MPWTKITRAEYQRGGLRYASDMTDAEWALIARRMPARRHLGRPREVDLRMIVQAILFILSTGCQWRALPKEFRRTRRFRAIFMLGAIPEGGKRSSEFWSGKPAGNLDVSPGQRQR